MNQIKIYYSEESILTESVCSLISEQGKLTFSNNLQYLQLN